MLISTIRRAVSENKAAFLELSDLTGSKDDDVAVTSHTTVLVQAEAVALALKEHLRQRQGQRGGDSGAGSDAAGGAGASIGPVPSASSILVGIAIPRSTAYVQAVLSVVLAGAAFMPVDPEAPSTVTAPILRHASPAAILFDSSRPGGAGTATAAAPPGCPCIDLRALLAAAGEVPSTVQQQQQEQEQHVQPAAGQAYPNPAAGASDDNPPEVAYVLFTSGSTGAPLGVCGTAVGLLNRLDWMQHTHPLRPGNAVVALATATSFVDHIWETFAPLVAGVDGVIFPDSWALRPAVAAEALVARRVTHLGSIPSVLQLLAPHLAARRGELSLTQLVSSGELLHADLAAALIAAVPQGCRVLNLYGSTEVAADCTCQDVGAWAAAASGGSNSSAPDESPWVPVGRPISGMEVVVLRQRRPQVKKTADSSPKEGGGESEEEKEEGFEIAPCGEEGEVWVAGVGLAAGYLAPAAPRAAQSFRSAPFQAADKVEGGKQRWFRTGDLGRMLPDGSLLVLGRADHLQAKVGGVRVDVAALEHWLAARPGVAAAAARAFRHPRRPQDSLLAAYLVPLQPPENQRDEAKAGNEAASETEWESGMTAGTESARLVVSVRAAAAAELPLPARPAVYCLLPRLPRSAAGKVLRSQLPAPAAPSEPSDALAAPPLEHTDDQTVAAQAGSAPPSEVAVMAAFLSALGPSAAGPPGPGRAPFEPASDFFTVGGGDSLAAAEAAVRLGIDVRLIFAYPTARSLAAALRAGGGDSSSGLDPALPGSRRARDEAEAEASGKGAFFEAKRRRLVLEVPPAAVGGTAASVLAAPGKAAAAVGPGLELLWREPLGLCVDAAPQIVSLPLPSAGSTSDGQQSVSTTTLLALACSHSGEVGCFELQSAPVIDGSSDSATSTPSRCRWRTRLPGRCDAGLCIDPSLQEVSVACSGGTLARLSLSTGALLGSVDCGGELRAAPAADPWPQSGRWWVGTHGRELLAVTPGDDSRVLRTPLPSPCSARVAFSPTAIAPHRTFVALLNGCVLSVQSPSAGIPAAANAMAHSADAGLLIAWENSDTTAPVFSGPLVTESGQLVVVGHVDGTVRGLSAADGSQAWAVRLEGQLFADLASDGGGGGVLAATHAGRVYCLAASYGSQLWSIDLGAGPISAAPAPLADDRTVVCCSSGTLAVLGPGGAPAIESRVLAAAQLPGELFSSPAVATLLGTDAAAVIVFGCRDDHLYCIRLPHF